MVVSRGLTFKTVIQPSAAFPIIKAPSLLPSNHRAFAAAHEHRIYGIFTTASHPPSEKGRGLVKRSYRSDLCERDNRICKAAGNLYCYRKRWDLRGLSASTHVLCRNAYFYGDITPIWSNIRIIGFSSFRKLWTSVPVQMGRRSSKIAIRKGAQDAKKAKLYGKLGKQIVSAVKKGGSPNPVANSVLASVLEFAKEFDVPKEIVERNIKKATEKGQQDFVEITYEAYGFGGVGLVVEVLTDNPNRAAANVRDVVKKCGGKMADPGSVLFNFRRTGVVNVRPDNVVGDDLLAVAMDAGAEDVLDPTFYEDEDAEDLSGKYYKVITRVEQYAAVSKKLQEAGIPVDVEISGLELVPAAPFEPDDEAVELNKSLMEKLLELDDVDAVYSNQT